MTRRDALWIVAALIAPQQAQAQAQAQTKTCRPVPETLTLNLGAGACTVKQIRVVQGAVTATIPVSELMQALGAGVPVK